MTERTGKSVVYLAKLLVLACICIIAGWCGQLVKLPYGVASPVWLPAGIALAYMLVWGNRYWPGVFLGVFLAVALVSFDTSSTKAAIQSILINSLIASGASLQAVLGAIMVRRVITFPNVLEEIKDISWLLFLGGLIACLISATVSSTVLAVSSVTTWEDYSFHWLTGWVGDVIGVFTMTPIILLLYNRNTSVSSSRKMIVTSSLLVVLSISIGFFFVTKTKDQKLKQKDFDQRAALLSAKLRQSISHYKNILVAVESFFRSSEYVSYDEFDEFTQQFFVMHPGIQALGWNPIITDGQRDAFEQSIRDQGFPHFMIKDQFSNSKMARSPRREQYVPVAYTVPYKGNQIAHGFDTYKPNPKTNNARRNTLDKARDTGTTRSTGRISIVQDQNNRYSLLLSRPIYNTKHIHNSSIANRKDCIKNRCITGYASGVFIIPDMVAPVIAQADKYDIEVVLQDVTAPHSPQLLYDSRTANNQESSEPLPVLHDDFAWSTQFDLAGRTCEAQFVRTAAFYAADKNWILWTVLVGSFVFTALFGVFILTVTANTDIVQQMVRQKTIELEERNTALLSEITDRQRAEEALRASEERFSLAIAGTSDGLWDWYDVTQDVIWWSPRFTELLGYRHGELNPSLSQFTSLLIHPDDLDRTLEAIRAHLEENQPYDIEYRLKTKSGEYRWFRVRGKATRDSSGKALRMAGAISDISDRKNTQDELLESEQRFRAIADSAPTLIWMSGTDKLCTHFNKTWLDFTGRTLGQEVGNGWAKGVHPDDIDRCLETYVNSFDKRYRFEMEYRLRRFDGEYRWIFDVGVPRFTPDGIFAGYAGSCIDITERKAAQENLKKAEKQLQQVADTIPGAMYQYQLTPEGTDRFLYVSQGVQELFGYSASQLLENINLAWEVIVPEDAKEIQESTARTAQTMEIWAMEFRVIKKDGQIKWILGRSIPSHRQSDGSTVWSGIFIDITEQKLAEEQLKNSESQLAQNNAALEQFLYSASHDLKSPVVTILGYTGHVVKSLAEGHTKELPKFVQRIEGAAKRMGAHVDGLLEVGRIGWNSDQDETIDINEVTTSIGVEMSPMFTQQDIAFDVQANMPKIYADRQRIWQLFENLIMNAVKYGSGNDQPRIQVGAKMIEEVPWFYVQDNGDGIAEKYHEKIFGMFHRLNQNKNGTGIGLTIVKRIVDKYEGEIRVESTPGQGTTFWVSFPSNLLINEPIAA